MEHQGYAVGYHDCKGCGRFKRVVCSCCGLCSPCRDQHAEEKGESSFIGRRGIEVFKRVREIREDYALTRIQAEVLYLRVAEGCTSKEVSEALGNTTNAVSNALWKARIRIKDRPQPRGSKLIFHTHLLNKLKDGRRGRKQKNEGSANP